MIAGRLRKRLTFHTEPAGSSFTVWGALTPQGGRTHLVEIRAHDFDRRNFEQVMDDGTTKIHMTTGDRVFDVNDDINQDDRHLGRVTMTVEERVNSSE